MDLLRRSLLSLGLLVVVGSFGLSTAPALAEPGETITVASTTSTEQSGLFKDLLPKFTQASGIGVKVVALGTGQALDAARRGDADVVLVHDTVAEEKFVGEGWSAKRYPVMYNDFVVVGPKDDPAGAAGNSVVEALAKIASAKAPFVSRGDRSGTHSAELRYWKEAGLDLGTVRGDWYKEIGQGMGPALNTASATNAYVLSDRGTWLSFKNRGELKILVEGDKRLFNQYGVMLVNPEKHPHVKAKAGLAFIDWLVSAPGQAAIASYKIGGEQLFFPNAGVK
ncbi:substrate-binding domain-containing protein [Methylobacterium sp. 77]|uniref:substrate-binding domain-containing protein n=1 Tax=Methylobacterium sp. 77 TaxID=1101192 RepID=UPI00036207A5|nr:substrate-binding domain-containing protein [Methylobacterium sp. 77]